MRRTSQSHLTFAGLAALTLLLGACHHARGVGYVRDEMPPGKPEFAPGLPEGYWVWQDAHGWHLRTTSDVPRHFHGNVETISGPASTVHPVGRAAGGVRQDGAAIWFDYTASGGEQGFDWAESSSCQRFELYIDESPRPLRVFLGESELSPARVPFAVCS